MFGVLRTRVQSYVEPQELLREPLHTLLYIVELQVIDDADVVADVVLRRRVVDVQALERVHVAHLLGVGLLLKQYYILVEP